MDIRPIKKSHTSNPDWFRLSKTVEFSLTLTDLQKIGWLNKSRKYYSGGT